MEEQKICHIWRGGKGESKPVSAAAEQEHVQAPLFIITKIFGNKSLGILPRYSPPVTSEVTGDKGHLWQTAKTRCLIKPGTQVL